MSTNLKVIMKGIQVLEPIIRTYPGIPRYTMWSAIFNIYLIFDSTNMAAVEKSISNLNPKPKSFQHVSLYHKFILMEKFIYNFNYELNHVRIPLSI